MIIATVCMMKNEEILAESAIRYWLEFSDFVMVFDHHSMDGTPAILNALKKEYGERLVLFEPDFPVGFEHVQKRIINAMIRRAFELYGADLVLPLDTDEFPFSPDREKHSVRSLLESLDLDCCYLIRRIPYVLAHDGDLDTSRFLPLSFTQTRKPLYRQRPKTVITGNTYRSDPICITMGNHTLYRPSGKDMPPIKDLTPELYYAHYPYQNFAHFKVKNTLGWLACYCNPAWHPGNSRHFQLCVEKLLAGTDESDDFVKWAVFSHFWATNESISDIQFETVDPHKFFPDIPLVYTNRFALKKDPFTLLLEQSLRLAERYKTLQNQNRDLAASLAAKSHQITALQSSFSYRLGCVMTWIPRNVCAALRCWRERGFRYALRRLVARLTGRA